ncbi:MAG: AlkA N-terminal domain-containing protein, partial [Thiomonas sp.]
MDLDADTCYQALLARDRRFDGRFFVGVSSTGIYCRPICAVRSPKQSNCSFFPSAAAAERARFRPCLRCRPELAPGYGLQDIGSRLAHAAAALIEDGFLNGANVAALARRVGVTERHLRRIFQAEFGASMLDFALTQRLLMAKRLLTETPLPMTELALAAGFGSIRRFNGLFRTRYGLNPSQLRKHADLGSNAQTLTFLLAYRPPLAWDGLLAFLAHRRIDGVENIGTDSYARTIALRHGAREVIGWFKVTHLPQRFALSVTIPMSMASVAAAIPGRIRRLFDLGARPDLIDMHLGQLAAGLPGMRVPGAVDGFEIIV